MTTMTDVAEASTAADGAVVRSLGRAEAWRLVRSPFVLAGFALSLVMMGTAGDRVNAAFELLFGYGLMPLAIGTCLAGQLLASRETRNATTELTTTAPAARWSQTAAALVALAAPVGLACLALVAGGTLLSAWDGVPVALVGGTTQLVLHPAELAQGLVTVAFFGAVGVAVGSWIPSRLAIPVVVAGLLLTFTVVGWYAEGWARWALPATHHDYGDSQWVQLPNGEGYSIVTGYDRVALSWHIAYVMSFTALVGAVALLRRVRSGRIVIATALLAAATAVLSFVQVT